MHFTDIFIRRPVLATVVSLLILVLGLRSVSLLPILQYPRTENAVVTVTTSYYGASADVVAGFITTPLEASIAQANGIDYMSSSSLQSLSQIQVQIRLNYDSAKALTEINTRVNAVKNQLPAEAQEPVITIAVGETIDSMYLGFNSEVLATNQISDYLLRVVVPKLQAVEGVQQAEFLGEKRFALRVWMDPDKLAAYGLTATDVSTALARNDFLSAVGTTKGQMVQYDLTASTSLHTLDEFRNLIVKNKGGTSVRVQDVANVTLGAEDYESAGGFDGKPAVQIGIKVAPTANLLDVIKRLRAIFPEIQAQLPEGLHGAIAYDATKFVNSSISEVVRTLVESLVIVTLVVFAFLGSPRSVLIPTLAIPLSLIGAFAFMLMFGFSINLLTLLALVLAIGLVVDDAIIVVENVNRHLEEGLSPLKASVLAARELSGPIVSMTVVLIAVYIPIGFMGGLTGALFTEFAFTLVGAVTVSAIVALTLSPMMCSRLLKAHDAEKSDWEQRLIQAIDRRFEQLHRAYSRALSASLDQIPVVVVFALIVIGSLYVFWSFAKTELAPQEDQGIVISMITSPPTATITQRQIGQAEVYKAIRSHKETDHVFQAIMPTQAIAGLVTIPWDERSKTSSQIQAELQGQLDQIPIVRAVAFQPPPLPGARGLPIDFVIQTTEPFERLDEVSRNLLAEAQKSGNFIFLDTDLKFDKPQAQIVIDRDKVADMGLTMSDVGAALTSMLGGGYVNYFSLSGRSYKVIPQVQQQFRLNTDQLTNYYIRTSSGKSIPLSTVAHIEMKTVPQALNHFQQLNAASITGVSTPGITTGQALTYLRDLAARTLPAGYTVDFGGQSRQFVQEGSALIITFFFALVIIFLTLAAQFESFRDPVIILITVPMSLCGALIFISLGIGGASLNIYTQVGLVTLIGLISKHGILIVEFANNLQLEGKKKREAIEEAVGIRLRPILMTTAAMVLGVMPLILASGAGAVSRFNLGLVIASGLAIGTLFTLFVVPAMYMLIAEDHQAIKAEEDALAAAEAEVH
ncbi:efflux RND transporter permease subunit [Parvibaculum sp.]|uniref:efflux RND transporter permease subunit n=1 Tax=Parvibaculum sp. TaxID=2024848 RepID=UPI00320ECBC3